MSDPTPTTLPSAAHWAQGRVTIREALAVVAHFEAAGNLDAAQTTRAAYLTPRLADVKVERDTDPPEDRCLPQYTDLWSVHPVWADVDRPDGSGWLVRGERLARRLERAIRAGKAIGTPQIAVDVNGNTYVNVPHLVLGRRLNADLRRLGF